MRNTWADALLEWIHANRLETQLLGIGLGHWTQSQEILAHLTFVHLIDANDGIQTTNRNRWAAQKKLRFSTGVVDAGEATELFYQYNTTLCDGLVPLREQQNIYPNARLTECTNRKTTSLSSLIEETDSSLGQLAVVIDVNGCAPRILAALAETAANRIKWIAVAVNDQGLFDTDGQLESLNMLAQSLGLLPTRLISDSIEPATWWIAQWNEALFDEKRAHSQEIEILRSDHKHQLLASEERMQQSLSDLMARHQREIAQERDRSRQEYASLLEDKETQQSFELNKVRNSLTKEFTNQINALQEQHKAEVQTLQSELHDGYNAKLAEMKSDFAREIAEIAIVHEADSSRKVETACSELTVRFTQRLNLMDSQLTLVSLAQESLLADLLSAESKLDQLDVENHFLRSSLSGYSGNREETAPREPLPSDSQRSIESSDERMVRLRNAEIEIERAKAQINLLRDMLAGRLTS